MPLEHTPGLDSQDDTFGNRRRYPSPIRSSPASSLNTSVTDTSPRSDVSPVMASVVHARSVPHLYSSLPATNSGSPSTTSSERRPPPVTVASYNSITRMRTQSPRSTSHTRDSPSPPQTPLSPRPTSIRFPAVEMPIFPYPFLAEDPAAARTAAETPILPRGNSEVSSSGNISVAPGSFKHLSIQSARSALSEPFSPYSGMAEVGTSEAHVAASSNRHGTGSSNRDSVRSMRSAKSSKSARSFKSGKSSAKPGISVKHWSKHESAQEWETLDDDESELWALVRRAELLERMLRAGKRASNAASRNRFSHVSSLTHHSSRRPSSRHSTPPRPVGNSPSSSSSRSKPTQSGANFRDRIKKTLRTRPFAGLASDDDQNDDEDDEGLFPDQVVISPSSVSRRGIIPAIDTSPPPSGAGIIVFPEIMGMTPPPPPLRNGEVCAQACLPPSLAVPLAPPPVASLSKPWALDATHGVRNLRWLDEKHPGIAGGADGLAPPHGPLIATSATALLGDVPACDDRFRPRVVKRLKVLIAVGCVVGIIIITGLVAGLLSTRESIHEVATSASSPGGDTAT